MKIYVFLFPIVLFLIFLCLKLFSPGHYSAFIQEDSFLEYMQAVFYFLSSVIIFLTSRKFFGKKMIKLGVLFSITAVLFLFISLEEISWGQRIFNIETPGFFKKHNAQYELTFHNLQIVQNTKVHLSFILIGAWGSFAWIFRRLFGSKLNENNCHIVNFMVAEWFLSSYFFFVFFIYTLFEFISRPHPGGFLLWRDQEPMELLLSSGCLLIAVTKYVYLQRCLTSVQNSPARVHRW